MPFPRPLSANRFWQALVDAGVLSPGTDATIRRLVIDAQEGCMVMMYVEKFTDERLLSVAMTLDGIEVKTGTPSADA